MGVDTCYLDGFVDVSRRCATVERWRPTVFHGPAIDADSVNKNVPPYGEARQILKSRNLMRMTSCPACACSCPSGIPAAASMPTGRC
ncbi:MAG: hypothetical protein ACLT8E_08550 [Akkermansia sp.]